MKADEMMRYDILARKGLHNTCQPSWSPLFTGLRIENVARTQTQISSFTARDKREAVRNAPGCVQDRARGDNQVDDDGHDPEPYRLRSGQYAILPRAIIVAWLKHNSQIRSCKTLPPRDTPLGGYISIEYKTYSQLVCLQLSQFYYSRNDLPLFSILNLRSLNKVPVSKFPRSLIHTHGQLPHLLVPPQHQRPFIAVQWTRVPGIDILQPTLEPVFIGGCPYPGVRRPPHPSRVSRPPLRVLCL